jgi:phage FluMu protein Com
MRESNETPPPGLKGNDLAEWWRSQGANMDNVETLSDYERECPRCKGINPCTGVDHCIECGKSLKYARKIKNSNRHSPGQ